MKYDIIAININISHRYSISVVFIVFIKANSIICKRLN